MSRSLKVASDEALLNAMMLFWREGYASIGTRAIEAETGITRFTLQTSYGGKKALYLKSLDHYLDLFEQQLIPTMKDGTLEGIARWIEAKPVPEAMHDAMLNGCLMVNSITEFPRDDADVNARAERFFGLTRRAFREALHGARDELPEGFDTEQGAELILACTIAANITKKSKALNASPALLAKAAATMVRDWARAS